VTFDESSHPLVWTVNDKNSALHYQVLPVDASGYESCVGSYVFPVSNPTCGCYNAVNVLLTFIPILSKVKPFDWYFALVHHMIVFCKVLRCGTCHL